MLGEGLSAILGSKKKRTKLQQEDREMNRKIKGILFDFNGTMFFDERFQERSWRTFLEEKIGRSVSDEEFQEYVHGRNAEITFSYFLQKDLTRKQVADLEEEKEQVYRKLCLENPGDFRLAEGLPAFLDALVKRRIPITIATASGRNNVRFFFEHLGLDRWFVLEQVVYNDGTIPGKPEPYIYEKAAQRLGIPVSDCAVFEDAKPGIEAAKRAGAALAVGVASMLEERVLKDFGADAVVKSYENLQQLWTILGM